uniref:Kazal-like domain-containing protein n=1 Tax=Anopheles atroparvus TaxID=41427 RepID=A0AAG5D0G4_ANOAO
MRLLWFFLFLLALVGTGAFGESTCPPNFEPREGKCVTPRPVHGTCREGSSYNVGLNMCVAD